MIFSAPAEKTKESPAKRVKKDQFNGTPLEEILQRKLPDHLAPSLNILFVCTCFVFLTLVLGNFTSPSSKKSLPVVEDTFCSLG